MSPHEFKKTLRSSLFLRNYLIYVIIVILSMVTLGTYMSNNIRRLKTEQSFYYINQQALTLQNVYAQQLNTLAFVKEKIYSVESISQPFITPLSTF